jgi:hypothetical protein
VAAADSTIRDSIDWNFQRKHNARILTSSNGVAWKIMNPGLDFMPRAITYGNGNFVVTGDTGVILVSQNCVNWTTANSNTKKTLYSVAYGNGKFISLGITSGSLNPDSIIFSADGITWTSKYVEMLKGEEFGSVAFLNNQFLIIATDCILTSADGVNWTRESSPLPKSATTSLNDITYGNHQFVGVGSFGAILSKPDFPVKAITHDVSPTINEIKISSTNKGIFITLPSWLRRNDMKMELFTIQGKKIYSSLENANRHIFAIPTVQLASGIYLLSLFRDNKCLFSSSMVHLR